MKTYSLDTESTYETGRDIRSLGVANYVRHPETDHYLVGLYSDDFAWVGHPKDAPWHLLAGNHVTMHNQSYDLQVVEELRRRGLAIPAFHHDCTADCAAFLQSPRSLADAGRELLGVELDKSVRDEMKGKRFEDQTPENKVRWGEYCLLDTKMTYHLWQQHSHKWPEHERAVSRHTAMIGARGIGVDLSKVTQGIELLKQTVWEAEQEIPWAGELTAKGKDIPATSPLALAAECRRLGIEPPATTEEKSEIFQDWLDANAERAPFVRAVGQWRKANRLLKVLEAMQARTVEGRLRYSLKFFGAVATGRWSGDAGLNCVTGDHEVLTRRGWVRIDQWDPQDEIAQWDNGVVSFVRGDLVTKAHQDDVVEVSSVDVSLKATKDHRVLTQDWRGEPAVVSAEQFTTRRIKLPTAGELQQTSKWTPRQVRLMVALAADGHEIKKRGVKNGSVNFGFRRAHKIKRLRELLTAEGIPFREKIYRSEGCDTTHFFIRGANKPAWFVKGFGPWVLELNAELLHTLVEELPKWDGYYCSNGGAVQFSTIHTEQAQWVKTAAHLCGLCASIKEYKRPTSTGKLAILYVKQNSVKEVAGGRGNTTVRVKPFSGTVYCPQVPSSFWLVRHEGKIHVTGNCQNLPRAPFCGVDARGCLVPGPGKKLIVADLSQIEPRVLHWLTGNTRLLDMVRNGLPIYEAYSRVAMGWTGGSLKKENPALYQQAKVVVLGLGYGAGAAQFQRIAKVMGGLDLTEPESKRMVDQFRRANRQVVGLWDKLDRSLRDSWGGDFVMELPSGRSIRYMGVAASGREITARTELGGTRYRWWGSKLCENLCQATARDVFADMVLRLEAAGLPVVLHCHDEAVLEVDENAADDALRTTLEIMSTAPEWAEGLPVAAEAKVLDCYGK